MPGPEREIGAKRSIPVIRLAELPALAERLAAEMRARGFAPDVVVYIETGARLLAHELGRVLAKPFVPIAVSRGGRGLKSKFAGIASRLPIGIRDWLRQVEERSGIHRLTGRKISFDHASAVAGRRILLIDDASDTGRTIEIARNQLVSCGVSSNELATAVLTATTPRAQRVVDVYLFTRNSRMPWSPDSDEFGEAMRLAAELVYPDARRSL